MSWTETVNALKIKLNDAKTPHRLAQIDLPWALRCLLNDDLTKEEFQAFVNADGMRIFFDCWTFLIESSCVDGVSFILDVLGHWMTITVRSFDETLGVQALLVYFLCERDEMSVDINWIWRSAVRLPTFLNLLFKTTESFPQLQLTATQILATVLINFPYSRVTPTVYAVCAEEGRAELIFRLASNVEADLSLRASVLTSFFTLGLGICFGDLYRWVPAMIFQRKHLFAQRRCPCSFCELLRRADRVARSRDEFGIEATFPVSNSIVASSLKAGIIPLVGRLLDEAMIHPDEVAADRALQHLVLVLNLALKHGREAEVMKLIPLLVTRIRWDHMRDKFDVKLGGLGPGLRSLLCLAARLNLQSSDRGLQDALHEILIKSSEIVTTGTQGAGARDCRPEMFWWLQPMSNLCLSSYVKCLEAPVNFKDSKNLPADVFKCSWSEDDSISILNAVVALADRLNEIHIDTADKLGNMSRMSSMVTLICLSCDGYSTMNVHEARRRVVAAPSPRCGFLLQSARRLRELYGRLFAQEGCVFIRSLLDLAIMRAEQGSALLAQDYDVGSWASAEGKWVSLSEGACA